MSDQETRCGNCGGHLTRCICDDCQTKHNGWETDEFQPTTARLIDGQVVIGTKPYTRWQRIKRRYWRLQTTRANGEVMDSP